MNHRSFLLYAVFALLALYNATVSAHPGSGIVVDSQGAVYFQDALARTIWKIDTNGRVTPYSDKIGGHWMALDETGTVGSLRSDLVERIAPDAGGPALLVADGGAPIAIVGGNLYYGLRALAGETVAVGLTKISGDDHRDLFAPKFGEAIDALGVTGLAAGAKGLLYVACLTGVMKLNADGTFTKLVSGAVIPGCDSDGPNCFLRGLAVDPAGDCYVAAAGCRCVIKISPDGVIETVIKAERPWSPTGVAVHGGEVYVLEYSNANGAASEGWLPRVRKLGRDGKVSTLASISEEQQRAQPYFKRD